MNQQSLRPLGLGEIIDTAFKIYTRHWRSLLLLVAVVVVPAGIASYLILEGAVTPDLTERLTDPSPTIDAELLESMLAFLGAAVLAGVIQAGAAVLATAGSMRAVAEIYLTGEPDWRRSLNVAIGRLPAILLTGLLIVAGIFALSAAVWLLAGVTASASTGGGALAVLALIVWLVLVPWLVISFAPAIPVLIVENASPGEALGRSFQLVKGRWWPTFGTLLTAWLIVVVLGGIASRILQAFLPSESIVSGILVSLVVSVATTPFVVCVLAVVYFDLRTRREPFDLGRLAADIHTSPPVQTSEPPLPPLPPSPERSDWPPLPPEGEDDPPPPVG